ncbi:hypothetical protein ACFLZ9_00150 [Patescibacteria group bacterium]
MAYDLYFTNDEAAYINFQGPGYIRTDAAGQNFDLTLMAANAGDVVVDDTFVAVGTTTIADTLYVNADTDRVGIGTSSPQAKLSVQGASQEAIIDLASSTGASIFYINNQGLIGIGSTSPYQELSINGDLALTGGLYDGNSSIGSNGELLMTTGSGIDWVATSSLGLGTSSVGDLADLGDVSLGTLAYGDVLMWTGAAWVDTATTSLGLGQGGTVLSGTEGQIPYYLSDGDTLTATSAIYINTSTGYVGISSTTPTEKLSVDGLMYIGGTGTSTIQDNLLVRGALQVGDSSTYIDSDTIQFSGASEILTTTGALTLQPAANNNLNITLSGTGDLAVNTDDLYVDTSLGRVGIGTTSPNQQLTVFSNADDSAIEFSSAAGSKYKWTMGLYYTDGSFRIASSSALGTDDRLVINGAGYLGIGSTTPTEQLSVGGLMYIGGTGTSTIQDDLLIGGTLVLGGGIEGSGGLALNVEGEEQILSVTADGFDLMTITTAQTTFYNPVSFDSAGDVAIAYDLYFANEDAAYINFQGPGYVRTDSSWQNLNLYLSAANDGDVIVDDAFKVTGTTTIANTLYIDPLTDMVGIGTSSPGSKLSVVDTNATNTDTVFGISTSTSGYIFRVKGSGDVYADGTFYGTDGVTAGSADYAEYFYTLDTDLESGEVVCVDVAQDNAVKRCARGADSNVMGIVSTRPAIVGNAKEGYRDNPNYKIIGMLGQVPAFVSTENGAIRPGDSLTSASSTPGYIMKANAGDSTVGVALEDFDENTGTGIINVLISRRNKSLTVEMVEAKITERIASMEIEDEVMILLAQAIEDYNIASSVAEIVDGQIDQFDTLLTVEFDAVTDQITTMAASVDSLIARMSMVEEDIVDIDARLSLIENFDYSEGFNSNSPIQITDEGNIKLGPAVLEPGTSYSSTTQDVAIVDITTIASTTKTALVVNQVGDADIADFQTDGVSVVNIADTGRVTVVGEMLVDGRIMVCSGGACGSALDAAVDETMGDMGIEGKVVAGAFEGYCEDGYIWVPGSAKYGTLPGFCVAQNEARLDDLASTSVAWTTITQGEAQLACHEQGDGYHLISENEWLTMAENIIRVIDNDIDPVQDGLQLATSQTLIGSTTISTTTKHVLSNGNEIFNLAGGVAEWTDQTVTRAGLFEPVIDAWQEYYEITDFKGFNVAPPYYYSSANGIGMVKTGPEEASVLRAFVRGQNSIFDLDLSLSPVMATSSVGFRCAR